MNSDKTSLWLDVSQTNAFKIALLFVISAAIKIILIPAYYSTDQDVHQNWMRITSNKSMGEWYFDVRKKIFRLRASGPWTIHLSLPIFSI